MTNEDAVRLIRNDMRLHHDSLSGEYRQALNMAIKALEQEPCEDAISRQAVLDMIENAQIITDGEFCGYCTEDIDINILPPVTPQQKIGHWMSHYDYCKKYGLLPSELVSMWWCDQCEQGVEHPTNFCPKCGAKMR